MAIDMTPEQRTKGEENFKTGDDAEASTAAASSRPACSAPAPLGGRRRRRTSATRALQGNPVKAALIGAGDEGGVLVGEHNPELPRVRRRLRHPPVEHEAHLRRRPEGGAAQGLQEGLRPGVRQEGQPDYIESFTDYEEMLEERKDIEAVVIALPLHLHAPVAIDACRSARSAASPTSCARS